MSLRAIRTIPTVLSTISDRLTKEDIKGHHTQPTLTFTAYAVQKDLALPMLHRMEQNQLIPVFPLQERRKNQS